VRIHLNKSRRLNQKRRRQRGSQVLEAGLVTVLMFGILFLLIDLSMLVFVKSTLQEAVKDGVRSGTTSQLATGTSYLNDSIVNTVQSRSLGFLAGAAGACKITINYYDPYTGALTTDSGGNILEVSVQNYNYTPLCAILKPGTPLSITVRAADIMEPCPLSGCPTAVNPNGPVCP